MNYKYYLQFLLKPKKKEIVTLESNSIYEISFPSIKKCRRLIIFDIDDTLGENEGLINEKTKILLSKLKKDGYKLALLSNSRQNRNEYMKKVFADSVDCYILNADKPNPENYKKIFKKCNVEPYDTIVVGDKVSTDLFGAFLAKVGTRILVKPYSSIFGGKKPKLIYSLSRYLENLLSKGILK